MIGKFRWTRGNVALLIAIALAAIVVVVIVQQRNQPQSVDLSTMLATIKSDIAHKRVDTLTVDTDTLTLTRPGAQSMRTSIGTGFSLGDTLKRDNGIDYDNPHVLRVTYAASSPWTSVWNFALTLLTLAVIVGILYFFLRRMNGMNSQALSFGKSRARM